VGILKRHGQNNYLDNTFDDFEGRLERDTITVPAIPKYLLYGAHCENCDESVTALRYKGRRILLHDVNGIWVIHQCPHPFDIGVEEGHPEPTEDEIDVHERADINEELLKNQWADSEYPDDPYNYPDIPYVAPGTWK
jgi:hypothetical protein